MYVYSPVFYYAGFYISPIAIKVFLSVYIHVVLVVVLLPLQCRGVEQSHMTGCRSTSITFFEPFVVVVINVHGKHMTAFYCIFCRVCFLMLSLAYKYFKGQVLGSQELDDLLTGLRSNRLLKYSYILTGKLCMCMYAKFYVPYVCVIV